MIYKNMEIDKIEELWSNDCKVDRSDLATESLKIPELHNKYYKIYTREKLLLKKMESDHSLLYKVRWEYYNGKISPEELREMGLDSFDKRVLKSDIDVYLQSDKKIIESNQKIAYQKEKIDFLHSILDNLKQRTWNIRNAIEFIKFSQGS
ncbi:hypothetical protein EBU71_08460 [bacterium]|nr:hypothetical protein [Candidatus Elulimicrobium humile]